MAIVVGRVFRTPEQKAKDHEDFDRRLAEQLKRQAAKRALMTPEELEAAERGSIT